MAATIKDIAQLAGCGVATVSSYLNGGSVRPKNREKIEAAIEELHYVVNETARQLKTNRTKMIGAVIPELNSTFCARVLGEVEDILRQHGYAMLVCDCRSDAGREKEAVDFLMNRRVDGLFVIPVDASGNNLREFAESGKPLVVIDRQISELNSDTVCVDNRDAIRRAVDYLVQKGHRNIGMIAGPREINTAKQRRRGYEDACLENGIPFAETYVYHGDDSIESGTEGIELLTKEHPEITAVVASSYRITMGAVIGANELGIEIPKQLSLIGFDHPQFARAVHPRLTIVNQPVEEIGAKAAEIMLKRLNEIADLEKENADHADQEKADNRENVQHIWLKAELLEGKSVAEIADFEHL